MPITLDKTIARDTDNTIEVTTPYSELNQKADNLVEDIVTHMETELQSMEDQYNLTEVDLVQAVADAETAEANAQASETAAETAKNLSVNAQIASENARDAAQLSETNAQGHADRAESVIIPTEATYNEVTIDSKIYESVPYAQHGLIPTDGVNEIRPQDMFEEVDVADTLVDKKGYPVRFTDGVYERLVIKSSTVSSYGASANSVWVEDSTIFNVGEPIQISTLEDGILITATVSMIGSNYIAWDSSYGSISPRYSDRNYIVKELPQFSLPKAPFATGSTDELLDDKVNGVTTQSNHSKGDIVVTGNDLTNTHDAFELASIGFIANGSAPSGYLYKYNGTATTNFLEPFGAASSSTVVRWLITDTGQIMPVTYLYKANTTNYQFYCDKDIFESYRGVGKPLSLETTKVKILKSNNGNLFPNQSYIALQDTTAGDLLTDTDKFKPIDYVTKQVALVVKKDSNGAVTNEALPLVNMYGESNVLTYEADIFGELGFSQKADRVWTDGSSEYILLGLKGYLNRMAFHPWFNQFGASDFVGDSLNQEISPRQWYRDDCTLDTSLYACGKYMYLDTKGTYPYLTGRYNSGGESRRPDSKFYDKTYIEGQGGLICYAIPNAKQPTYKHIEEAKRNLVDGYIETRNNITTHSSMTVSEELTDTAKTLWDLTYKALEVYQVLYTDDGGVTWNTQTFTHDSVNNQITLGTARADILVSYSANNQPAIPISTPQPIEYTDRDLIATNHHSVYAYNGLTYASSGKVATGGAVEAKGVDDVVQDENSDIFTTPNHVTLTLDSDSIVGSKALVTHTEDALQVFTEEMVYDTTWGDNGEFNQLTEGTLTDLNANTIQTKVLYKPTGVKL